MTLIISLNSQSQKTDLDFVIGRLLNEEARQEAEPLLLGAVEITLAIALAARTMRDKSRITCYRCRKLGHFQSECMELPAPAPDTPDVAANIAHTYYF
jgi:hypothetical protein